MSGSLFTICMKQQLDYTDGLKTYDTLIFEKDDQTKGFVNPINSE